MEILRSIQRSLQDKKINYSNAVDIPILVMLQIIAA